MLGLPWPAATTLASLAHVRALARSRPSSLGGTPIIEAVAENRVTPLAVYLLLGVSLRAATVLRRVPMAALDGFFLYLGVTILLSSQLIERLTLLFVEPACAALRLDPTPRPYASTLRPPVPLALCHTLPTRRLDAMSRPYFSSLRPLTSGAACALPLVPLRIRSHTLCIHSPRPLPYFSPPPPPPRLACRSPRGGTLAPSLSAAAAPPSDWAMCL